MIFLSIVLDKAITADTTAENSKVSIGTPLPLQSVKGTVSVQKADTGGPAHLDPADYTVSIVDESTVLIDVASGKTALADGDIVNIVAITEGEIARP